MSALSQAVRLLQIAGDRNGGLWSLFRGGMSVSSYEMAGLLATYCPTLRTIIDAGANRGQFALAAARRFPDARVFAFEPLPDLAARLDRRTRREPRIRVFDHALGALTQHVPFYRNAYTHVSSMLPIHSTNDQPNYDGSRVTETQVSMVRLDDLATELAIESPTLLKMDVQGYERAVLEGAKSTLSRVDFLVFEVAFRPLYLDQALFDEMHVFVRRLGYELVAPVGVNRGRGGVIIEMDMLYRRASAA